MATVALEFVRPSGQFSALGTDVLVHLDGRWGTFRRTEAIYAAVDRIRKFSPYVAELHFVGVTRIGTGNYGRRVPDVKMSDRDCPSWAR